MSEWSVVVPVIGEVCIYSVKAETEEEAIELAIESANNYLAGVRPPESQKLAASACFDELMALERIVTGHVFNGSLNEVSLDLVVGEDDEDDEDEDGEEDEEEEG
jgi:hypothetical protein